MGRTKAYRRPRRRPAGQALVELALVAPILMLILGAVVQLGLIYERQIGIQNAVRDAARRAATFETTSAADGATNGSFTWHLLTDPDGMLASNVQGYDGSPSTLLVSQVCYRTEVDPAGDDSVMVDVRVRYAHPLFMPLVSTLLDGFDGAADNAFQIEASAEFRVQNRTPASVDLCRP